MVIGLSLAGASWASGQKSALELFNGYREYLSLRSPDAAEIEYHKKTFRDSHLEREDIVLFVFDAQRFCARQMTSPYTRFERGMATTNNAFLTSYFWYGGIDMVRGGMPLTYG